MREVYIHKADVLLERKNHGDTEVVEMWSYDGDKIHIFPGTMADDQIMFALDFANKLFGYGVEQGAAEKVSQIKAALDIKA